ncbi:UNVERIFIED_CONTAM: DCC family protein, chloroplastic [Sesamum calycinum]|uniref:DCC family protein, chloroplastic n=1 Tax=Sesamum calycinum TaxID=2727403 RepID=A0AAW2NH23_9LAMI
MALIVPINCASLKVPRRAHVSAHRRRFGVSATLSSPPRGDAAVVDWVKETASFFEQDSRPIMLFDGNVPSSVSIRGWERIDFQI